MKFTVIKTKLRLILFFLLISCCYFIFQSVISLNEARVIMVIGCILMVLSAIVLGYELFLGRFSHSFFIDREGVKYIKNKITFSLTWEQISFIGLASNEQGFYNKNCMIYFDGRNIDFPLNIKGFKDYGPDFFGVQYRKKIIKEIRKYWSDSIQGIYQVER